jgi:tRNA threonylcarbamoyladenosine biosynthesis protein TsaB
VCAAGVVQRGEVWRARAEQRPHGQAAHLPVLTAEVLAGAGPIGLIAVTVGPGSFTGLRAALSLAHGLAAGWACPIVGVTVPEAMAWGLEMPGRDLWVALHSRPGRVFLARGTVIESLPLDDLPLPNAPPWVTGNAADQVVESLRRRGVTAEHHPASAATPTAIAAIALARHAGRLPPLPAQPLYIDAPEARPLQP